MGLLEERDGVARLRVRRESRRGAGGTNRTRGEGIYLQGGPIGQGERAHTRKGDQSDEGRGHIPAGGTNRTRGEGTYPQGGPIGRGEREYYKPMMFGARGKTGARLGGGGANRMQEVRGGGGANQMQEVRGGGRARGRLGGSRAHNVRARAVTGSPQQEPSHLGAPQRARRRDRAAAPPPWQHCGGWHLRCNTHTIAPNTHTIAPNIHTMR
eukprot:6347404-Pyramimonas_sp.AAC.2